MKHVLDFVLRIALSEINHTPFTFLGESVMFRKQCKHLDPLEKLIRRNVQFVFSQEKDQADWHADDGSLSRKDLVAIIAILFLNKTNIASATPPEVTPKADIAYHFWEAVAAISGFGESQARERTVAAQPVVLKALAKLVYDFAFSNRRPENSAEILRQLLDGITELDFSHQNMMWQYFDLSESDRVTHHVSDLALYLPDENADVNRDIGKYQGGFMRFGAKHNDIYPIIGDMIRWKLRLPNRHKKSTMDI